MTNEEKIIEIDEFLQRCEDWMHGEDSKTVTRCRKLLFQLNDELSKLHQPTVISSVCNSPCCKEVGVFELPLGSEWYCKEHYKQNDL